MTDDLHDQLTAIQGVGDATAAKIIAIVGERGDVSEHLQAAREHIAAGRPGMADKFIRRAQGERE